MRSGCCALIRSLFETLNAKRRLALGVLRSVMPRAIERDAGAHHLPVTLGATRVQLEVWGTDNAPHIFINLHENERTSVCAARALLAARHDSRLIVLRGQGHRHVVFWIGLQPYLFDPNRIFSDAGIEDTLRYHGAYSSAAHAAVARLRDTIMAALQPDRTALIVALHNNGIGRYTIDSYQPGGTLAAQAQAVHRNPDADAGDFFLVSHPSACTLLRDSGHSVVLQQPDSDDDGSLSQRFMAARPLYINAEARHGHVHEQYQMLATVLEHAAELAAA